MMASLVTQICVTRWPQWVNSILHKQKKRNVDIYTLAVPNITGIIATNSNENYIMQDLWWDYNELLWLFEVNKA